MTTVIALKGNDRIVVGSDSACGDDKTILQCGPKFFESNGIVWGLCGFVIYEQALRQAVKEEAEDMSTPSVTAENIIKRFKKILKDEDLLVNKDGFKEMKDSKFFFIENNRMFYLDEDLSYWETKDSFMAIGSGSEFALGALHAMTEMSWLIVPDVSLEQKVNTGLHAAANFNPFVKSPFHIEEYRF